MLLPLFPLKMPSPDKPASCAAAICSKLEKICAAAAVSAGFPLAALAADVAQSVKKVPAFWTKRPCCCGRMMAAGSGTESSCGACVPAGRMMLWPTWPKGAAWLKAARLRVLSAGVEPTASALKSDVLDPADEEEASSCTRAAPKAFAWADAACGVEISRLVGSVTMTSVCFPACPLSARSWLTRYRLFCCP